MVSYRELPVKTLPTCLLLDLRRKNIRVPQEIQMIIMWYKEIAETRDRKEAVHFRILNIPQCHMFLVPQHAEKDWKSSHRRVSGCRQNATHTQCHWCLKFYKEMLTIGMRAELSRPVPNLDRLFAEGGWMGMELYRHRTIKESVGTRLCHVNRRSATVNTAEDIMKWTVVTCSIVDLITEMEVVIRLHEQ